MPTQTAFPGNRASEESFASTWVRGFLFDSETQQLWNAPEVPKQINNASEGLIVFHVQTLSLRVLKHPLRMKFVLLSAYLHACEQQTWFHFSMDSSFSNTVSVLGNYVVTQYGFVFALTALISWIPGGSSSQQQRTHVHVCPEPGDSEMRLLEKGGVQSDPCIR